MNLGSRNTSNSPVHVSHKVSNQYPDGVFPLHPLLRLRHTCLAYFHALILVILVLVTLLFKNVTIE